jgi:CubicO group peptidase (beta-lactamase class C family)
MRSILIYFVIFFLLIKIGSPQADQQVANPAIDGIFSDLTKPGSPGCALGIFRDGEVIYARGYGLANIEENVPITAKTVFDVGSLAKQFTAASILLLEQQGKLRLQDDVYKYLPDLPDYSSQYDRKITILDLLNHTSGLRDYVSLFLLSGINGDNVTTNRDAFGIIACQKSLNFSPGSDWQYSNSGYLLLSLIVEKASGKSLKEFAAQNIFQPLGMLHTQYRDDHTLLIPHRALGYDPGENGTYKLSVSYGEETGDGMVQTSIEDLHKWDETFYSGGPWGTDFASRMEQKAALGDGTTMEWGKGLFIGEYRGQRIVWDSGGSGGYHAYTLRFPQQHFSITCLCNRGGMNRAKRVRAVADLYLDHALEARHAASASNLTSEQLQTLVGQYRDPMRGDVYRVSLIDGQLWIDFEGNLLEIRPTAPMEFEPAEYPMDLQLRFEPAHASNPRRLIIHPPFLSPVTADAVSPVTPSSSELALYAGDYWSDELRATYRLGVRNSKLQMVALVGADGIIHDGEVPFDELRPSITDEFDLKGAPIIVRFLRNTKKEVTGFILSGFHERGILFARSKKIGEATPLADH